MLAINVSTLTKLMQAQQFMFFCFVNKQQVLVECGQSKKQLAVSGDYSSLQRILKEAFEID